MKLLSKIKSLPAAVMISIIWLLGVWISLLFISPTAFFLVMLIVVLLVSAGAIVTISQHFGMVE